MKRFLALFLALSILFSMSAANVTAVGEQSGNADIVYVEETSAPEVTEETVAPTEAETEAAEEASETSAELEIVGESAPVLQENTHSDHAACPCGISDAACADHSTAAAAETWQPLSSLTGFSNTTAGNYYLTGNLVLSSQLYLKANINICLNGYSIIKDPNWTANTSLIRVYEGCSVTIMNCKAAITNGRLAENSAGISGGNSSGTNAGAIWANKNTVVNVYGVNISGNSCSNSHTGGWTAGGILVVYENNNPSTLNVAYSRFENNKATASGGGAVIIQGGTANIRNTVFSGNEAKTKGGAIWMAKKNGIPAADEPAVYLTDCDFSGNKVTDSGASGGACLYTNIGSATFTRVAMTGNVNAGNSGTAITYEGTAAITLDDCTVTGNTNTNQYTARKAGIAGTSNNASITIAGATVIDDNMNGTNGGAATGVECNLYLRTSGSKLTVGALETGASIRVTTGDHTVADDPSVFLNSTTNTSAIDPQKVQLIVYENRETAGNAANSIGYNTETGKFSFGTYSDHWHAACACGIEDAVCADHTSAAEPQAWTPLSSLDGFSNTTAGNYYLTTNLVLTSQLYLQADINICLNGYSITRDSTKAFTGALIRVADNKSVTIMNCKADISDGRLTETSAGISGGSSSGTNAGAIHANAGSTLNVYGVRINDNSCTNNNANGWTAGGIIVIFEDTKPAPTLNVAYSRFDGNKATASGGGAIIIRGGTANIRNTVFSGNEAKTKGGAIWMTNKASAVYLTDCDFTGNKVTDSSASGGACLYANIGTVVFTRVNMTGNTNAGNSGTAITCEGTANVTLDDCTVTGNTNTNQYNAKKAGIAGTSDNASITVSGATVIDDNINGTNGGKAAGVECNLYLRTSGSKLTVGALESGASIRVTTGDHTVEKDPDVFLNSNASTPEMDPAAISWIVYENRENVGNTNCVIGYNDTDKFYFGFKTDHYHAACACAIDGAVCADHTTAAADIPWQPWNKTDSLPTDEGNYYLTGNVVLTKQQVINNKTAICLNGFDITQGTRVEETGKVGALIKVDKGDLVLMNCGAELSDGKLVSNEKTSRISGATSDMREGAAIQVAKDRSLAVYGIEICDNTGTSSDPYGWNAAAILAVADEGSVTDVAVNYCRFARNKSVSASGGAIILRGGTADIRNTVFEENEALTKGGAIWMMNKSPILTMENCTFTGNKVTDSSSSGGACMYLDNGTATLTNVEMTENVNNGNHGTAITYGGSSALILDDCVITDNTNTSTSNAKKGGIGTVNSGASLTVKGSTVIDNNINGTNSANPVECNLYLRTDGSKLIVDKLEEGANIRVTTGEHKVDSNNNALPVDDPDVFLGHTANTPVMTAQNQPWIIYENREKANIAHYVVSYGDNEERFYFSPMPEHNHTACACALDGVTCASHTDSTVYRWIEWTSTTSLPTAAGYYYLSGDVVLSEQQYINAKVGICLNGFSITEGTRTEEVGKRNAIIRVGDKGNLTIVNCQASIQNDRLAANSAGINGFTADGTSGGAIHVNAGSTLRVFGVAFNGNTNTNENPHGWTAGAILVVSDEGRAPTLEIAYSRFEGNKATNSSGGAVIIRGGTADIRNTVFTGNEAGGKNSTGGALWLTNLDPQLTITDCEFTGNKLTDADSQGGAALYMTKGTAVLTNVTMTGNENTGHHGTAISLGGDADLTLQDCTITNNTNTNAYSAKKAGVAVLNDNVKLTISGATVVDKNMNGTTGTAALECNIYLRTSNSKVTLGQLSDGANVEISTGDHNVDSFGVTLPVEDPDVFITKGVDGKWNPAWDNTWVTYGNNGLKIGYSDDKDVRFYFVEPTDHVHCLCGEGSGTGCKHDSFGWVAWDRTDSLPTTTGNYYLTANVEVIKTQNFAGTSQINICLNGHNITPAKGMESVILNVYDDAHLSISDCTASGSGSSYKAGKITKAVDGAVRIGKTEKGKDAVLNLYDGMITTNHRKYYGGGIRMVGVCTFNMYGGRISSNRSNSAHGGGIGAEGGAVINIYAGTIHGNTAYQSGGGIMVKKSTVNVHGGTISKNNAYDNGGGIYAEHGSVYISGGNICYNEAIFEKNAKGNYVGQGGGVFVRGDANNEYGIKLRISGGNFYGNKAYKGGGFLTLTYVSLTVTGGNFYQNTAINNGGGIFPANDTKGTISGCKVYENEAVSGGGVAAYLAELEISDCEIYENTASEHGAGILIQRESEVTMDNVIIRDNTAQKYGGALRMDNKAQLEMNDCLVTGNATGETGTVFASGDGTLLTLNNTSVVKNKASISGGGVSAMSYARIIMNSGEIKENSCLQFGGGAYIRKGYMELHGGEICDNTAVESGGGLHIEGVDIIMQREILLMTDGLVSGNSASIGGGARFISGKSTVTGGTFENNTADYGGGIAGGSVALTILENIEVKNNSANVNGGGMYLHRGSRNVLTDCVVTNNYSKEDGAGIWLDDDFTAHNLTVTDNTSDNGVGGIYIAPADYDGHSYVSSVIKLGGKILITDNKGTDPGMFISEGSLVNLAGSGLTHGTKIDVKLQSGLLTRTVIGAYDYEGGNLEYVITAGDRSVTDPEIEPETDAVVDETPADDEETKGNGLLVPILVAGGALLVVLLILILLFLRRKKRENEQS